LKGEAGGQGVVDHDAGERAAADVFDGHAVVDEIANLSELARGRDLQEQAASGIRRCGEDGHRRGCAATTGELRGEGVAGTGFDDAIAGGGGERGDVARGDGGQDAEEAGVGGGLDGGEGFLVARQLRGEGDGVGFDGSRVEIAGDGIGLDEHRLAEGAIGNDESEGGIEEIDLGSGSGLADGAHGV